MISKHITTITNISTTISCVQWCTRISLLDDLLDHPTAARTTRTPGLTILLVYYGMAAGAGSMSLFVFDGWNTESHHSLYDIPFMTGTLGFTV